MRIRRVLPVFLTSISVLVLITLNGGLPLNEPTAQAQGREQNRQIVDKELVRNSDFEQDKTAWSTHALGTHVGDGYGKDDVGFGMQIQPDFTTNYGYIFQELYFPTQVTAAGLSFDYKFLPQSGAQLAGFWARLATDSANIATALFIDLNNYPGETWRTVNYTLTASELNTLNTALTAGERIYVTIDLSAQFLYVNVDNVSVEINGSDDLPTWTGSIAYIGLDKDGYATTVKRIDPDGSKPQTLWTHPDSGITNEMYDVAWNPMATELAFSSDHEAGYSAFNTDVYGIKPDGTALRRITNPPAKADLDSGNYQFGTITGQVQNNYGITTIFQLYIQGAKTAISVDVGAFNDTSATFTVPEVADLEDSPYVVFTWSNGGSVCKEYPAAVFTVSPGNTVDIGTLAFNGTCGSYNSTAITWKRDGSELGVDVITPHKFAATGEAIGTDLFNAPTLAGKPTWSPLNDTDLLYVGGIGNTKGIFETTVGAMQAQNCLVPQGLGSRPPGSPMEADLSILTILISMNTPSLPSKPSP